jgi:hypothetical protein
VWTAIGASLLIFCIPVNIAVGVLFWLIGMLPRFKSDEVEVSRKGEELNLQDPLGLGRFPSGCRHHVG